MHPKSTVVVVFALILLGGGFITVSWGGENESGHGDDAALPPGGAGKQGPAERGTGPGPSDSVAKDTPRPVVIAFFDAAFPDADHPEMNLTGVDNRAVTDLLGLPIDDDPWTAADVGHKPLQGHRWKRVLDSRVLGLIDLGLGADSHHTDPEHDHSTATISRAVGETLGACPECRVVHVSGDLTYAMGWIAQQSWIDVLSLSVQSVNFDPDDPTQYALFEAVLDRGKAVFQGNGNSVENNERYWSGSYATGTVMVGMTTEEGAWAFGTAAAGADIAAPGSGVRVATAGGGNTTTGGTSFSTPYLAGVYGKMLMTKWASGELERVEEDGRIRQRLGTGVDLDHDWAKDGHLDARDVLATMAPYARLDMGPTRVPGGEKVVGLEPSYWAGHGAIWGDALEAYVQDPLNDRPAAPEPGPGYAYHLKMRHEAATVHDAIHDAYCMIYHDLPIVRLPVPCADAWLENSDWYEP